MNDIRVMPQSIDAEQSLIGGLMVDNSKFDLVSSLVNEQDFYRNDHRIIFRAIHALTISKMPYDMITISEFLEKKGRLEDAGGLSYIGHIAGNVASASNIEAYAKIIKSKAKFRRLIEIADGLCEMSYQEEEEAADKAIKDLMAMHTIQKRYTHHIKESLAETLAEVDEAFTSDKALPGVPYGLVDIDDRLGGMRPGHLIVVGGRPKMGKTAYLLNTIDRCDVPVGFISAEQGHKQISLRMISISGKVDSQKLSIPKHLGEDDWPKITAACGRTMEKEIYIYDKAAPTIDEIEREARRMKQEYGIELLVVDYIQRIKCPGRERRNEVAEITQRLKEMARELEIPVMAGAQVSRKPEERADKRPMSSDLKEAGELEQEADVIFLLYRDEVYNPDTPDAGVAEVNISANRHGPTGLIKTTWLGKYLRFEDAEKHYYSD